MAIQSKLDLQAQLAESGKRLQKVRQRKETERATVGLQEAEPRQPPQVDLTRR